MEFFDVIKVGGSGLGPVVKLVVEEAAEGAKIGYNTGKIVGNVKMRTIKGAVEGAKIAGKIIIGKL